MGLFKRRTLLATGSETRDSWLKLSQSEEELIESERELAARAQELLQQAMEGAQARGLFGPTEESTHPALGHWRLLVLSRQAQLGELRLVLVDRQPRLERDGKILARGASQSFLCAQALGVHHALKLRRGAITTPPSAELARALAQCSEFRQLLLEWETEERLEVAQEQLAKEQAQRDAEQARLLAQAEARAIVEANREALRELS